MAIQHTWKITRMDSWVESKLVYNVHFAIETIDTDKPPFKMIQNHAVSIPHNPLDEIVAYDDLTEEQVINWVKEELGDNLMSILESGEAQLNELIHPKIVVLPLPWVN